MSDYPVLQQKGKHVSSNPVASIKNVSKTYHRGEEFVHALQRVSFDLYPAEMVSLVGASGCGKSTCINMLAGVDEPDEGEITVCGHSLTQSAKVTRLQHLRNNVGIVFQAFYLMPYLTVEENVTLPLSISGKVDAGRVNSLIERVGLSHRKTHFPAELSGGEQQRTAIARALVHRPALVLADEPTGNLDQATGHSVMQLLDELRHEEKVSLLIATHDSNLADRADRTFQMRDGQLQMVAAI